jgi:hypothetical protein
MADKKISALTAATTPLAGTEVLPIVQSGSTVKVSAADVTAGRAVSMASATISSGNLSFSSTAQRITGDFSNATVANRVLFQTTGTNTFTQVGIVPSGTGTYSVINTYSSSDPTNSSFGSLLALNNADVRISSGILGTGTYLPMTFYTGGSKRIEIGTGGDVTVSTGNLIQGTAGKGINFTANANAAGMTSELLNWYEEGTWTPVYATTGNPYTSVTYGIQSGTYTRIGRMVSIKLRIRTSAVTIGSASGALIITGLPFTSAASGCPVTIGYADTFSTNAPINAEVNGSATSIALYYRATVGGSVASMQYNYLSTGAADNDLTIAGFYYV